jgi:hypothetical protein
MTGGCGLNESLDRGRRDQEFQNRSFQNRSFQNRSFQNRSFQNRSFQNSGFQNGVLSERADLIPCRSGEPEIRVNRPEEFPVECHSPRNTAPGIIPAKIPGGNAGENAREIGLLTPLQSGRGPQMPLSGEAIQSVGSSSGMVLPEQFQDHSFRIGCMV